MSSPAKLEPPFGNHRLQTVGSGGIPHVDERHDDFLTEKRLIRLTYWDTL